MQAKVYSLLGEVLEEIELPSVFNTEKREDLIQRAVVSDRANERQPYGVDVNAGLRTSADYFATRRRTYRITIGREISRLPREKPGGGGLGKVRIVPQSVKGRQAHPPKVEKKWEKKMNKKEYLFALKSAIASINPIIVEDAFDALSKTKEINKFIETMRIKNILNTKKILIIVNKNKKAIKNIKDARVISVSDIQIKPTLKNLKVKYFAPGAKVIDQAIWTKSAIKNMGKILE